MTKARARDKEIRGMGRPKISETDYEKLRVGMRVQAVFKEEGVGNMLDILYFKPIPSKARKSQVARGKA